MAVGKKTTCPYCGVGCGVRVDIEKNSSSKDKADLLAVSGDAEHPANRGKLCVKGSNLGATMVSDTRLRVPRIEGQEVSWDDAIKHVADGFRNTVAEYGPDSVAFYLSGQLLTEDYYVANKLMKGFIGSSNVDTNSRLCMAAAVAAHKRAFGEDVVPCDYEDLRTCELLVMVGSNAAWAHPVLFQMAQARQQAGELKIVVIDPRVTATAQEADEHLAIAPGSDLALFNGLLGYLQRSQNIDTEYVNNYTQGFAKTLKEATQGLNTITDVASLCGLATDELENFYQSFAATEKVVTLYSQGVNQSMRGVDQCNAIINCHLATGRIGKPGMGPFSITGQPNAMGGREVGGMANTLAAHMDFDEADIDRVQRFWQAPRMARAAGLKAVDMFDAVASGQIKAIWIMATNPAASLPDSDFVSNALANCPLVVVSDCYLDTDTVKLADVALPAQGWGEKDGTVTNSERCISRQRRLVEPDFDARADWQIVCEVAQAMGFIEGFNFASAAQVFVEHAGLANFENQGQRLFCLPSFEHMSETEYADMTPISWPINHRPFSDGRFSTPDGRARFIGSSSVQAIRASEKYPLLLNTGRLRDQWHTMSRTGLAAVLNQHTAEPRLDLHPQDAQQLMISTDDLVQVSATTGQAYYLAQVSEMVNAGEVFAPIHWTQAHAGASVVSRLVPRLVDAISGQPQSKQVPVSVKRVPAMVWLRGVCFQSTHYGVLREYLHSRARYWSALRGKAGLYFEAACSATEAQALFEELAQALIPAAWCSFRLGESVRRQNLVRADETALTLCQAIQRADLPAFVQMVGEHTETAEATQQEEPRLTWRSLAFSGHSLDTSAQICSCFEVSEAQITECIATGISSVDALGEALRCGTNCGSCVPELKRLVAQFSDATGPTATSVAVN